MKTYLAVTTAIPLPGKDGYLYFPAEFDVAEGSTEEQAIEEVRFALVRDGVVKCHRLTCPPGDPGKPRKITFRQPVILGVNAVQMISAPHFLIVGAVERQTRPIPERT